MKYTVIKNGIKLYHHDQGDFLADEIIKNNNYFEFKILDKLKSFLPNKELTILEVGANIGNHVSFYLNNLNVSKIYAYEPLEDNYKILEKNSNSKVEILKYGLGNKNDKINFFINKKNYGEASTAASNVDADELIEKEIIIKKWEDSIPNVKIDFIKVDIEGSEEIILKEIGETVISNGAALMIECNIKNYKDINDFVSFGTKIISNGYVLKYMHDSDYIFVKEQGNMKRNKDKFISHVKNEKIKSEIWRIRSEYDITTSRTRLNELSNEYKTLKQNSKIKFQQKLIWSKIYRIVTFKRAK